MFLEKLQVWARCEVKVIDLGSSCFTTDQLSSYVQSRSYRAPEVILGLPYGPGIDVWSLGCILAELLSGYVLFQARASVAHTSSCSTSSMRRATLRSTAADVSAQTTCWQCCRRILEQLIQFPFTLTFTLPIDLL